MKISEVSISKPSRIDPEKRDEYEFLVIAICKCEVIETLRAEVVASICLNDFLRAKDQLDMILKINESAQEKVFF